MSLSILPSVSLASDDLLNHASQAKPVNIVHPYLE
jgi:hypothetical protein